MTLDEIRAEKVKMEEAIFHAVTAAQDGFELKTGLRVKAINLSCTHHDYISGGEQMMLSSVRAEVDPW